MTHTPTPWTLLSSRTLTNIKGPKGEQICQLTINDPNATFIVQAVNNHDNLVAALQQIADGAEAIEIALKGI